ncbi:unnamed protein product [Prorocentrum cordatum]|uniref:Uncharacterized protein n=1 Tax=Prorocentrum cordatum TaxID=2364126 RepID=A0ABN9SHA7_9DINO|nr:unnamed protein product [Polarella glacialis]
MPPQPSAVASKSTSELRAEMQPHRLVPPSQAGERASRSVFFGAAARCACHPWEARGFGQRCSPSRTRSPWPPSRWPLSRP